jgi:hypothetical protein
MDLQARNTQDLSFASMNSTAMALARQMLAEVVPSPGGPYFLPVTGRETVTPSPSAVVTLKPVFTLPDPTTPTLAYIPPTATRKKQDNPPITSTYTPAPTKTLQPRATNTPTKITPTKVTVSPVPSPTDPPTKEPTVTPVPPTHTSAPPPTDPPTLPPPTDPPPTSTPGPEVTTEPPRTPSTP